MRKLFYGRIAVGKSTVGREISSREGVEFVDCDKEVWNHYSGNAQEARKSIRNAIESGNREEYKKLMKGFSDLVDWKSLFSKDANYEVSVFGNFYNIGGIPKEIAERFDICKIMCFVDTREANIKDRKLDKTWVSQVDFLFEEPQDLKVTVIFNEDILGERTPESKDDKIS